MFREAMQYISAALLSGLARVLSDGSNLGLPPRRLPGGVRLPDDERVNVYRDICNQLVLPSVSKKCLAVIGISIGTQMQLMAGLTFCKMIKESFPEIRVVVGGNVVTRLQEEWAHHERFFTEVFDAAILYEGEHALLWYLEAVNGQRAMEQVPNLMYRDTEGCEAEQGSVHRRKPPRCRCRISTGCRWIIISCPERIIP